MLRRFMSTPLRAAVVATAFLAVIAGATSVALASIPDSHGVIHGCYQKSGTAHNLRVINNAVTAHCPRGYSGLNWSQAEPKGSLGPAGLSHGYSTESIDGHTLSESSNTTVVATAKLPAGSYIVNATSPGAALIGTAGAPPISLSATAEVVGLAIVVALAATLVPAIRAARSSTIAALNDVARPPGRPRLGHPDLRQAAGPGTVRAQARRPASPARAAQVFSALPGAILGIPLGVGLFKAAVKSGILPPPLLLTAAAAAAATLLAVAALTAVPAWLGTRQPVAEVLQSEAA